MIYFRKEGRALGEVTKYLVYNARMPPQTPISFAFHESSAKMALNKANVEQIVHHLSPFLDLVTN